MKNFSRIGYIHIPKTAGRTIRQTLGRHGLVLPPKVRGTSVHFRYEQLKDRNYDFYFSTIRDPLDWLQSFYFFSGFHANKKSKIDRKLSRLSFDEFIMTDYYNILKTKFGHLKQSDWVKNLPIENLLRVSHLQDDLNAFCKEHDLITVKLNSTGVNSKRNRSFKPNEETLKKIKKVFAEDYDLINKLNNYRDVKSSMELVYD